MGQKTVCDNCGKDTALPQKIELGIRDTESSLANISGLFFTAMFAGRTASESNMRALDLCENCQRIVFKAVMEKLHVH